jgi:cation:H+ antiporter
LPEDSKKEHWILEQYFAAVPIWLNLAIFAAVAAGVWFSGTALARSADAISQKLKLNASLVGLVLLASATSLPEMATTLNAALLPDADLVLTNLFGGIALQTAVLAFADYWAAGSITNYPRKANHALEATMLVALSAMTLGAVTLGETAAIFHIGFGSILIGLTYIGALVILRNYDLSNDWVPVDIPDTGFVTELPSDGNWTERPVGRLFILAGFSTLAILFFGYILVALASVLAVQGGVSSGLIGVSLLAAATSLPELATTIAAVRLGAYTLAISNIFGSNLIMLGLVLPADILYLPGPILQHGGKTVAFSIVIGILVTAIYLSGLIIRRKARVGPFGIDSVMVLVVYAASLILLWKFNL